MEQFQYLSLSSGSSPRNDDNNGLSMPPLSPLSSHDGGVSPVLKHEHDPFAFEWAVKREVVSHDDSPDADCSTSAARSSSLFQSLAAFALPSLPPVAGTGAARPSFDLSSVDGTSDCWSQLASLPLQSSVNKVRFAANPTSLPQFTFDSSASVSADSSSAPSSPVSRRGSMTASSSSANSRAASPHSPWSAASDYDDDVSSPVSSSSVSGSWSPSSSHSSVNSPSSSSIRSSLSAFRSRTHSVSSSSSSVDDDIVDCDASPDADIDASLSPLADAAAISMPCTIRTSSLKGSKSSITSSPVLSSMIAPTSVVKPIAKSASSDSKRGAVVVRKSSVVGPTGLPVTPMCSPSACDAIAAASTKSSLREVGRYTLHFVPDCDNPRPPKAKATPLNIYFAPSSGSSSSLVPVRIRLRPQAPRSFRNVVKTARTYTTMHGVAPPADASDKDPSHFLYFSITAIDSQTKLAGPQAAHVVGRGASASASNTSSSSSAAAACGDRTRRQAKFKHADDKKEYQGHVQLDLSQPGDGARLEVRLYSAAPLSANGSLPRFHVATSSCDHKFAQMYVADLSSNTSNRV